MKSVNDIQIQGLARSGLVTHMIRNSADVDSVFAVAKVQDLPEITFAAAFDDGRLVIGCQGDLPEVLIGFAEPVTIEPMPEASSPPPAQVDFSEQFAALHDAISALQIVPPPASDLNPPAQDGLSKAPDFAPLSQKLDEMAATLTGLPSAADLEIRLQELQATVAEANPADHMARIQEQLSELQSATPPQTTEAATNLTGLEAQVGQLASEISALADRSSPPESTDSDNDVLEEIDAKLAVLLSLDSQLQSIAAEIAKLGDGFEAASPMDDSGDLVEQLQPCEDMLETVESAEDPATILEAHIQDSVELDEDISPPQGEGERLTRALGALADRFEAVVEKLREAPETEEVMFSSLTNRISRDAS